MDFVAEEVRNDAKNSGDFSRCPTRKKKGRWACLLTKEIALQSLARRECQRLLSIVREAHGLGISRKAFTEVLLELFEDISGLETIPPAKSKQIIDDLWSNYMAKKPVKPKEAADKASARRTPAAAIEVPAEATNAQVHADLTSTTIQAAIVQGRAMIADGKSKADAARAIFACIKDESKDLIVAAFVEGATLTPKGALTYWYNCKRRASKATKSTSS